MSRCREALLKYMWFVPILWAVNKGYKLKDEIAKSLGVSRRFVSSALYYMRKTGLMDREGVLDTSCKSIEVVRRGRWFACILGETVIVVHLTRRKATHYTVPLKTLEAALEGGSCFSGKLCSRINKALYILGRKGLKD